NNFTVGFQYWNNLIDSHTRTPYFLFPDGVSFGTNINVPQKSSQHKFQFRDDFSHSLAKHTLRMGVDFVYEPEVGGFFENNPTHQEIVAASKVNVPTVPTTQTLPPTGVGYTPSLGYLGGDYTGLPKNDNLDISPRVGFSYDLLGNGRFVLRGGYGLYFGQTFENIPLFMIQQANSQVFANTYSINCNGPGAACSPGNNVPGK